MTPAQQVHVQMRHGFAGIRPAVDDQAVAALGYAELPGDLPVLGPARHPPSPIGTAPCRTTTSPLPPPPYNLAQQEPPIIGGSPGGGPRAWP